MIFDEAAIENKISIGELIPPNSGILRKCIDDFNDGKEDFHLLDVWSFRGNGVAAELPDGLCFHEILCLDDLKPTNELQIELMKEKDPYDVLRCEIFKKEPIILMGKINCCYAFLDIINYDLMLVRPEHLDLFLEKFVHTGKNLLKLPYRNKTVVNRINRLLDEEDLLNFLVLVKKI